MRRGADTRFGYGTRRKFTILYLLLYYRLIACSSTHSVEEDAQLSFHLFGGLPLGPLAAGLPSRAIFISHSALALSTCSFQYRRRSFVHLTTHSSLISLLLILSHSVRPSIDLSVFISVDLRSCSVLVVSARVPTA